MITSAISSAARLSLAPAKLAGQMAGALLRGLRGDTSRNASAARRSTGTTPARRGRAHAQGKRSAARSSEKRQPKSTAARAGRKDQTSAARSKRTAARTSAQARPKRADRTKPQGDAAIAREVESTIFRDIEADQRQVDVNVAGGVVRLRGEVPTPDLINELEARAARVPQVRRVENLLRTPAPPPEPATPEAQQVDPASIAAETSGAPALREPTNLAGVSQRTDAAPAGGGGGVRAPRTGRWGDTAEPPTGPPEDALEPAGRQEGDRSAGQDEPSKAEPDRDRSP
jgi:osmotically-inducible protein OsmY